MLEKYYFAGKSRRYNDMFYSPASGHRIVFQYARHDIRNLLADYEGYKQILYLEKPDNSNSLFFIVFTINGKPYRLKTRNFSNVEGEEEYLGIASMSRAHQDNIKYTKKHSTLYL